MLNKSNNDTNSSTFIIIAGLFVLFVFTTVTAINLMPYESNSYFAKDDKDMTAKIEEITIKEDKLFIKTSGNSVEYCVKTTRSRPNSNALCWNDLNDNEASTSIIKNKKYYVWIKDSDGMISNYKSINVNED